MFALGVLVLAFATALCDDDAVVKPLYGYRYETEDLMQTAETSIPLHGYHVVEGGYYPTGLGGVKPGFGGGYGNHFPGGYGGGFGGGVGYGGGIGHIGGGFGGSGAGFGGFGGFGGQAIDNAAFSGGKKNVEDGHFEKAFGKKGDEFNHGEGGFSKGEVAAKNVKGDAGYYNEQEGGKKLFEEGKEYHGAQHFDKEGKRFLLYSCFLRILSNLVQICINFLIATLKKKKQNMLQTYKKYFNV